MYTCDEGSSERAGSSATGYNERCVATAKKKLLHDTLDCSAQRIANSTAKLLKDIVDIATHVTMLIGL
jgi:hypothetical protein